MGLDTTHDCWNGPYSAFSRFRNYLAQAAGYKIIPAGTRLTTGDVYQFNTVDIDWTRYEDENYFGEWGPDKVPDDKLLLLIVHSDCEGVIRHRHAGPLADRLEELEPAIAENFSKEQYCRNCGQRINDDEWVPSRLRKFIDGLREAEQNGEDVEFY